MRCSLIGAYIRVPGLWPATWSCIPQDVLSGARLCILTGPAGAAQKHTLVPIALLLATFALLGLAMTSQAHVSIAFVDESFKRALAPRSSLCACWAVSSSETANTDNLPASKQAAWGAGGDGDSTIITIARRWLRPSCVDVCQNKEADSQPLGAGWRRETG